MDRERDQLECDGSIDKETVKGNVGVSHSSAINNAYICSESF